jgi:nitrogenase molybdenum-iron protein alpha chain
MVRFFGDQELIQKTEEVIEKELCEIEKEMDLYKTLLKNKTACLFVGGSRAHTYQLLLDELGVKTILAGYEFAHRDDYEGREVIPDL